MNDHEEMILRNMEITRLEGHTCEWTDCEQPAREVVETVQVVDNTATLGENGIGVLTQRWYLCVKHAVIARTVPADCAIDW